jgi:hypothetical protein
MSYRTIYGSVNFPFASSSVSSGDSNVLLKDFIECSSNSTTIYNDLNRSYIYGSFSLLSNAIYYITPSNNLINSTFSFTNNSINISSFSNINEIYGAYIYLDTKNDSSNPVTLTSSFYLDNNSINISSYCNVYRIYAAYLDLVSNRDAVYHPNTISISSNSISISSSISNCYQISFAQVSLSNCEVDNLLINNNTLSFTNSDIDLSTTPVYLVNTDYSKDSTIHNSIAENNSLNFINATNVSLGTLLGFDSFSFALPNNLPNNQTILYLRNQSFPLIINAQKLSISNYDHFTSPLSINLIDAYGSGNISLSNTNGSYLYNTRTELKVIDNTLIFTFNPSISDSSPITLSI